MNSVFYVNTYKLIKKAATAAGLTYPHVIAKLGAAQAYIETGAGKHIPHNNLFGIKNTSKKKPGTIQSTTEVINGQTVRIQANFNAYTTQDECCIGYVNHLVKNPRFHHVLVSKTIPEAIKQVALAGWATDPTYASKLVQINTQFLKTSLA
jgi:flagellar protein FlgJ